MGDRTVRRERRERENWDFWLRDHARIPISLIVIFKKIERKDEGSRSATIIFVSDKTA
jgi:hypothetical protein